MRFFALLFTTSHLVYWVMVRGNGADIIIFSEIFISCLTFCVKLLCPFTYKITIFWFCFNSTMNQPISLAFPDFIYSEPTLASGGGVEVVTLANPAWFTNNGFSTDFSCVDPSPRRSHFRSPSHHQIHSFPTPCICRTNPVGQ